MNNKKFLMWIRDRLVYIYKENELFDFVQKLVDIAQDQEVFDWPTLKDTESGEIVAYYNPKFIRSK
jgi:hypothetical protein